MKKAKGITLIALIITIIVLLILAMVSISLVMNGDIVRHGEASTSKYALEEEKEKVQLVVTDSRMAANGGAVTNTNLQNALKNQFGEDGYENFTEGREEDKTIFTFNITNGTGTTYKVYGDGTIATSTDNGNTWFGMDGVEILPKIPETSKDTGPLLTAINTENYGKKVIGFKSKGEDLGSLVWRVFYEDEKNIYLISETAEGDYPISDLSFYYSDNGTWTPKGNVANYKGGEDISSQARALMPKVNEEMFTTWSYAHVATAYLSSISEWEDYTDEEGRAVWAMGGPTYEMFESSFNACGFNYSMNVICNSKNGYKQINSEFLNTSQKNGIYRLKEQGYWWLCAPCDNGGGTVICVQDVAGIIGDGQVLNSLGARPIVCIPRANFNYTLE